METIAVFVNDAAHARHLLQPMLQGADATHWVLVACLPAFTRHVGRWVSNAGREHWRQRWAQSLFAQLEPCLRGTRGSVVEKLVAGRPLTTVSARLARRFPAVRLLDARASRIGKVDEPVTAGQPDGRAAPWAAPLAITAGLSAVLALAD